MTDEPDMFPEAKCPHDRVKFMPTPQLIHHGREDCERCGAFLRWVSKPSTLVRIAENAERLALLRDCRTLTEWERSFVFSCEKAGHHLSPKQQTILERIANEHA